MRQNYNTVFFDLDGTLLDTAQDLYLAFNELYLLEEGRSLDVELSEFKKYISFGGKYMIETIFNISAKKDIKRFKVLLKKFLQFYSKTLHANSLAFPGIEDLLSFLTNNNIKWGIVTNKVTKFTLEILGVKEFLQTAEVVVCGDMVAKQKPHPEPLLLASSKIGVEPRQCVYIGDSETDILAGNAANMLTIAATFGYVSEDTKNWPTEHKVDNSLKLKDTLSNLLGLKCS